MSTPNGFPGLDFAGCVEVTFVLRDFQVITGKIRGVLGERFDWNDLRKDHKDDDPFKKDFKDHKDFKDDKDCKEHKEIKCETKCDVDVKVKEECKFILVELTRPSAAVNLSEFLCNSLALGIDFTVSGTTFPVGRCVAINCENIIYAGPGAEFCDIPIYIGPGAEGNGLALAFKQK
jgi:hypothetical protein